MNCPLCNNNILFAGREMDWATGLYYNRARWYDPATGVFLTPDPAAADVNLYRYCGNNPISRTDPTGLDTTYHVLPFTETYLFWYQDPLYCPDGTWSSITVPAGATFQTDGWAWWNWNNCNNPNPPPGFAGAALGWWPRSDNGSAVPGRDWLDRAFRAKPFDRLLGEGIIHPLVTIFISNDPIEADINLYRYVFNNPVTRTDPLGLCECSNYCDEMFWSDRDRFDISVGPFNSDDMVGQKNFALMGLWSDLGAWWHLFWPSAVEAAATAAIRGEAPIGPAIELIRGAPDLADAGVAIAIRNLWMDMTVNPDKYTPAQRKEIADLYNKAGERAREKAGEK